MPRTLARFPSSDPTVTRIQDQILDVLNPVLRTLPDGIGDKPTVTGATGGNAALESLIAALADMGLIVDETT